MEKKFILRFIRPFKILKYIEKITYKLAPNPKLASIHDIFMSMIIEVRLRLFSHPKLRASWSLIEVNKDLSYKEKTINMIGKQKKINSMFTFEVVTFNFRGKKFSKLGRLLYLEFCVIK